MLHFGTLETSRIDASFDKLGISTLLRQRLTETALIEHRDRARVAHDADPTQRTFASTHPSAAGVKPAITLALVSVTHQVDHTAGTNLYLKTVVMPLEAFKAERHVEMPHRKGS